MTNRIWEDLLTERDRRVIEAAGYDTRGASNWDTRGVGDSPIVLVVDVQRITVGRDVPILDAIEESTIAMGEVAWEAVDHIGPLLDHARDLDVPVTYTRVVPPVYWDPDHPELAIIDALAPESGDDVVDKRYASAFFGSDLTARLVRAGIDTLVVVGDTTSGCLRATVVEAQQLGFHVMVPQECVFDRIEASHKIGLLDMWMKYAAVLPTDEVRRRLGEMAGGPAPAATGG